MNAIRGHERNQDSQRRAENENPEKPEALWDLNQLPFTCQKERLRTIFESNSVMQKLQKRLRKRKEILPITCPFFLLESKQAGYYHIIPSREPRFPLFHHCTPLRHARMDACTSSRTQDVDIKKLATGSLFLGMYSGAMISIYLENIEKPNFIESIFLSLLLSSGLLLIKNSFSGTEKKDPSMLNDQIKESVLAIERQCAQLSQQNTT